MNITVTSELDLEDQTRQSYTFTFLLPGASETSPASFLDYQMVLEVVSQALILIRRHYPSRHGSTKLSMTINAQMPSSEPKTYTNESPLPSEDDLPFDFEHYQDFDDNENELDWVNPLPVDHPDHDVLDFEHYQDFDLYNRHVDDHAHKHNYPWK
jgi:hypothetical protein